MIKKDIKYEIGMHITDIASKFHTSMVCTLYSICRCFLELEDEIHVFSNFINMRFLQRLSFLLFSLLHYLPFRTWNFARVRIRV